MGIYNSSNSKSEDKVPLVAPQGWPREDNDARLAQDAVGTVGLKDQQLVVATVQVAQRCQEAKEERNDPATK